HLLPEIEHALVARRVDRYIVKVLNRRTGGIFCRTHVIAATPRRTRQDVPLPSRLGSVSELFKHSRQVQPQAAFFSARSHQRQGRSASQSGQPPVQLSADTAAMPLLWSTSPG